MVDIFTDEKSHAIKKPPGGGLGGMVEANGGGVTMLRDQVFIAVFFVMPPGLFTLAAIFWQARLTEGQLVSGLMT